MAPIWRPLAWTLLLMLIAVTLWLEVVHVQQGALLRQLADPAPSAALAAPVLRLQSLSQALIVTALVLGAGLIGCAAALRSSSTATETGGAKLPADVVTLSRQLQHVTEKEKAQLARSLHDELGGLLIAVKMDTSWLQKRWPQPTADVQSRWERVFKVLDDGVDYKRRVVEQLRPTLLDNMGLVAALRWVTQDLCNRGGLSVADSYPDQEPLLSDEASILVFRLVQEALINVVKHAHATDVHLDISNEGQWLTVLVEDNGVGIGERTAGAVLQGLTLMELRVRSLGGVLEVQRLPAGGTLLRARVPSQGSAADAMPLASKDNGARRASAL